MSVLSTEKLNKNLYKNQNKKIHIYFINNFAQFSAVRSINNPEANYDTAS